MSNYLDLQENKIQVIKPVINFEEYTILIHQAQQVADYIDSITLTDENVKDVKKILANANKSIKALNDKRIAIKKEIMEPYEVFNQQIKDIESLVKDADQRLRDEVRTLEEKAREEKKKEIENLWEKRVFQYEYASLMDFYNFLENKHLNKSYPMSKVEDDMVEFLEKSENDLKILCTRDDKDQAIEIYMDTRDLGQTLLILGEKKKQAEEYKEKLKDIEPQKESRYAFVITGNKDKNFVEMLLKNNEINYELKEI